MSNETLNQTQFSSQEPILEKPVKIPTEEDKSKKKKKKPMLIIIFIIVFIFLLLFILLLASIANNNGKKPVVPEEEVETEIETEVSDPLVKQIKNLELQLDEADPSKKDMPYPAIKEIGID